MKFYFSRNLLVFCCLLFSVQSVSAQAEAVKRTSPVASEVVYRIHYGDKLSVKFLYHPELNEPSLAVRPDGKISLQIIDDVKVVGLSVPELKAYLEKAYSEDLLRPVISVNIVEFKPPRVFIGGQVTKPGSYDLRDGQKLVQIIFLAGGFTKEANRKTVLRARLNENGKWEILPFNVLKILDAKETLADIDLQDGDYIFVPDSKLAKFSKIVEAFQGVLPVFPIR